MSKFRFHWGWAIGTFYGAFVLVMLIIVIRSFSVDHSLVVDDYYSYDINYQEHSDKLKNTRELKEDISFEYRREKAELHIHFPSGFEQISGSILFYKPDNKKLDFTIDIGPDEKGQQLVDLGKIVEGYWRIKIEWEGDGTSYYKEHSVYR